MKKLLVSIALIAVAAFGIKFIGDSTQTRPDERDASAKTEVTIHLEGRNYRQSLDTAAYALWGSCSATVNGDLVDGIQPLGDGDYVLAVTPTLGDHGRERLLGCMNDLGIDRLKSNVESAVDIPL